MPENVVIIPSERLENINEPHSLMFSAQAHFIKELKFHPAAQYKLPQPCVSEPVGSEILLQRQ